MPTIPANSTPTEVATPPTKKSRKKRQAPATVSFTTGEYVARPTRDWAKYNNELRDRPAKILTLIIDTASIGSWRDKSGHAGQPAYSAGALSVCYMLRAQFGLSLRATEAMARLILGAAGLDSELAPDFSTLSRRRGEVGLHRPRPMCQVALIDGTGYSFKTHGPWVRHKWRGDKPAQARYVRVTLCTDGVTGAFVAAKVTNEYGEGNGEVSQFEGLVEACAELGATTLIGDGAYDNTITL